jgi:hypothetical protein
MELLVVFYILATLAVAYLWIYPKYIGKDLRLMAWADVLITAVPMGISAVLFWESDPQLQFLFGTLNWFFFTLFTMLLIEFPILFLYLRARGLSGRYWQRFKSYGSTSLNAKHGAWAAVSREDVVKGLNDTKWDGLRTISAKRILLWSSNFFIIGGTVFLLLAGDNPWASYVLIHILLILVFWFLLRTSVRLIADAPDDALDEMHMSRRNEAHVFAFRAMAMMAVLGATIVVVFAIVSDSQSNGDGFHYLLPITYTQVQALFWFTFAYATMLPSMRMLAIEIQR